MSFGIISAVYLAAAILFILSLGGLSGQESAKRVLVAHVLGKTIENTTHFHDGAGAFAVGHDRRHDGRELGVGMVADQRHVELDDIGSDEGQQCQ